MNEPCLNFDEVEEEIEKVLYKIKYAECTLCEVIDLRHNLLFIRLRARDGRVLTVKEAIMNAFKPL